MHVYQEAFTIPKKMFFFIKSDYKTIRINIDDVMFLSGLGDYSQIHLKGKTQPITTQLSLKEFESKLSSNDFIRVHRSYIVSVGSIDMVCRNEITINNHRIPIGNAYKKDLELIIEKHS